MKKLTILFVLIFSICCCAPKKYITDNWMNISMLSKTAIKSFIFEYNRSELDSILAKDGIPSELSLWVYTPFLDDSKNVYNKYMYNIQNNVDSLMNNTYIIEPEIINNDTLFHLEIRKVIFINN